MIVITRAAVVNDLRHAVVVAIAVIAVITIDAAPLVLPVEIVHDVVEILVARRSNGEER